MGEILFILLIIWPILLLLLNIYLGYRIAAKGASKWKSYLLADFIVSLITSILLLLWTPEFCSIDGGEICHPSFKDASITFGYIYVIGLLLILFGSFLRMIKSKI